MQTVEMFRKPGFVVQMSETELEFTHAGADTPVLRCSGSWTLRERLPNLSGLTSALKELAASVIITWTEY